MEDQAAEEDPYSDDDLDALPDNAFHELEENAVKSTQQAGNVATRLPSFKSPRRVNDVSLAGGFGRLSVAPEATFGRQQHTLPQPSSDYGDFDAEMLDGEIYNAADQPSLAAVVQREESSRHVVGESTQRELWRHQRYAESRTETVYQEPKGLVKSHPARNDVRKPQPANNHTVSDDAKYQGTTIEAPAPDMAVWDGANVTALQSQIQKVDIDPPQPFEILAYGGPSFYKNGNNFSKLFR